MKDPPRRFFAWYSRGLVALAAFLAAAGAASLFSEGGRTAGAIVLFCLATFSLIGARSARRLQTAQPRHDPRPLSTGSVLGAAVVAGVVGGGTAWAAGDLEVGVLFGATVASAAAGGLLLARQIMEHAERPNRPDSSA